MFNGLVQLDYVSFLRSNLKKRLLNKESGQLGSGRTGEGVEVVARAVTALARPDVLTQGALTVRTQANVLSDAALSVLTGSSRLGA
jgi:hypothetical protein